MRLKKEVGALGRFYSTYNDCGYRADLYPRYSHDIKFSILDSANNKSRSILVMNKEDE